MEYGSLLLLAVPVLLLLLLTGRQRRQQRETLAVQQSVTVGQEVMTGAGMYATVVEIDGDVIVLESVPGHRSRWDRRAIVKTLTPAAEREGEPDVTSPDDPPRDGPTAPTPPAGA